ncbi:MAG: GNAT family N-acetyltransferase [Planctomycetota bacterium]
MPLEVIDNPADLRALEPEWAELAQPTPMQSPAWLIAWWEACGESDGHCHLATLAVRDDDGRLIGLAPWYLTRNPLLGPTLRVLGDGRAATDHSTLLCGSSEHEPAVVTAVARWIVDNAGHAWRRLRLENLDADDRPTTELFRLLEDAGIDTEWVASVDSFPIAFPESVRETDDADERWDAYLASLSKNRRKKLRRWQRDWFDTERATVRVAKSEADRRELWPLLVDLHGERRRAMGEQGVFDLPEFNRFHDLASARLLAEGRLYLALLELDGEPAAIEYALRDDDCHYAYQGGISVAGLGSDAGHLSMMATCRAALAAGNTRFDLLRGDEPYKLSWGATRRASRTLHARPRDTAGSLEGALSRVYRGWRDRRSAPTASPALSE